MKLCQPISAKYYYTIAEVWELWASLPNILSKEPDLGPLHNVEHLQEAEKASEDSTFMYFLCFSVRRFPGFLCINLIVCCGMLSFQVFLVMSFDGVQTVHYSQL